MATKTKTKTKTIIEKIADYLNEFMYFQDPDDAFGAALWAASTWMFHGKFAREPWVTGYLYINSTQPASGKTTLIKLLYPLVLNPEQASRMTSAAMYSLIGEGLDESGRPTIFVDEIDTVFDGTKKNEDLRGVVNSGYERSGYIIKIAQRYDEEGNPKGVGPRKFPTFGAKALAGIDNKRLDGTIRSRCIEIKLAPKPENVSRTKYFPHKVGPIAEELAQELSEWVLAHGEEIALYEPPEQEFDDRQYEITMQMLQVAHAAECEDRARQVLARMTTRDKTKQEPEVVRYLRIIREMFLEGKTDKLASADIVEAVGLPAAGGGRILSTALAPLGIERDLFRIDGKPTRGYRKQAFCEAWEDFLGLVEDDC